METIQNSSLSKYSDFDKLKIYFTYVYLALPNLKEGNSFDWKETDEFSQAFIKANNIQFNEKKEVRSMGGYIREFNDTLTLTYSSDNELILTAKGERIFKELGNEILEYGKSKKFDILLSNERRSLILSEFLNEIK